MHNKFSCYKCRSLIAKRFRQIIKHLLQNIWKQKLGILFIAISCTFLSIWYSRSLPHNVYDSQTTLTIRTHYNTFPTYINAQDINKRLIEAIQYEVLNDSSLQSMINDNKLFEDEFVENAFANSTSTETIRRRILKSITVEPDSNWSYVSAFQITYRDTNPENARRVLLALTDKLVSSQSQIADSYPEPVVFGKHDTFMVLSSASVPHRPIITKRFRIIAFGMFSGLFLGMILALIYGLPEIFRKKPE